MKRDLVAAYDFVQHPDHIQRQVVDYLVGAAGPPREAASLAAVTDPLVRIQLLAQTLVTFTKTYAQTSDHRNRPSGLRRAIEEKVLDAFFEQQRDVYLQPLGLESATVPDLTSLPRYSFALHFTFRLHKPYLSQDDTDWCILDNPVRKDKVFGLPMVAPTGWKGALRAAMRQEKGYTTLQEEQRDEQIARLLGNVKGEEREEAFRGGRLHFYPTFFTQIGLEVINPHPRDTDAGQQPIYFECVPIGAEGTFTMLYVPLGMDETQARQEAAEDLQAVAKGIRAMMREYGFGAKTSSGFGAAEDRLATEGKLVVRAEFPGVAIEAPVEPQPEPSPDLPRYLESPVRLHPDFRRPDGSLKTEEEYQALIESRGQKYAKRDRQLYEKAKAWWEREGRVLAEAPTEEPEPSAEPAPLVAEWTFTTISELQEVARKVATLLREGGIA